MLPERVAITSPSSGVKPIVVSTERPPRIAASDAPAPRWQVTMRSSSTGPAQRSPPPAARRRRATGRGSRTCGAPSACATRAGWRRSWRRPASPAWKAVSKQATAGTSGRTAFTAASAASDFGWWSGARSVRASQPLDHPRVDADRAARTPCRRGRSGGRRRRPRRGRGSASATSAASVEPRGAGRSAVATTASSGPRTRSLRLLDPALTTRIRPADAIGCAQDGHVQSADLRGVLALEPRVRAGLDPLVHHQLAHVAGPRAEARDAVDDVDHEVVAVEVVEHDHVERRRGGALLLVAADVQVGVVRPAVGEPVDQPRVAVVGEDDRPVRREQRVELRVGQAVRVLRRRLEAHQVDDVDEADLQLGQVLADQVDRGQRLEGRDVAGAGDDDVGLAALVVAGPVPDPDPARAVEDRLVHREPVRAPAACRRR